MEYSATRGIFGSAAMRATDTGTASCRSSHLAYDDDIAEHELTNVDDCNDLGSDLHSTSQYCFGPEDCCMDDGAQNTQRDEDIADGSGKPHSDGSQTRPACTARCHSDSSSRHDNDDITCIRRDRCRCSCHAQGDHPPRDSGELSMQ